MPSCCRLILRAGFVLFGHVTLLRWICLATRKHCSDRPAKMIVGKPDMLLDVTTCFRPASTERRE
jgi:hypothetical protein